MRILATAAALGVLGALATTGTASAGLHDGNLPEGANLPHQTIKVVEEGRNRIVTVAGFHPDPRADDPDPSVQAALDRFGKPSRMQEGGEGCEVEWPEIGLTIWFANFGVGEACEEGRAQRIMIGGENARGWHTNRDIYIRSATSRARDKYPARYLGTGRYSLLRQYVPFGESNTTDLLVGYTDTQVETPRIQSFELWPLAAGD